MSRAGALERLVGQILASRYRVGEPIGEGAMGTVFRAEHVKIGRRLAVKVLHPRMLSNERYRRRFDREAELAGRMHHPNLVGVLDVGITPEGLRYLVMEYVEGLTLSELIDEGPLPGPRVLGLVRQLCDGLQHAHDHGLIHRDFKPDNVIVECNEYGEDTPRILDFGIAIEIGDFSPGERKRLTTEGMVLGTPHYMAPEHAAGQAIDHRIDLFALGLMCFELLTGVMPFEGTGVEIARAYLSRAIPPMAQRAPQLEIDPLLEAFTRALLARTPAARLPSAKAARELLDLIEHDRGAAARQLGVKLHPQRRTLPVSPAPPPGRAPSGTKGPVPTPLDHLPTEKMSPDPEAPMIVAMAAQATEPALDHTPSPRTPVAASPPPAIKRLRSPAATDLVPPLKHVASSRRRSRWIAAALAGVGLCAIGAHALRGGEGPARPAVAATRPETPAATQASAPRPEATPAVPPLPPATPAPPTEGIADPPAAQLAPAPPPPVRPAVQPPPALAVAAPAPPVQIETPRPDPTTAAVAELYGTVGRSLKRLDETRGQEATFDLWPRFRLIHILEALRTRDGRIEAHEALRYLEQAIEQRSH